MLTYVYWAWTTASRYLHFFKFWLLASKPSLKIRTASAIFWNYLGIFRDYGLKSILLGIKLFLFFKIESWNFQHLFEKEFRETSQNFNSFSSFRQFLFPHFVSIVWLNWNFMKLSRNSFSNRCWKFPKKIYNLGRSL